MMGALPSPLGRDPTVAHYSLGILNDLRSQAAAIPGNYIGNKPMYGDGKFSDPVTKLTGNNIGYDSALAQTVQQDVTKFANSSKAPVRDPMELMGLGTSSQYNTPVNPLYR